MTALYIIIFAGAAAVAVMVWYIMTMNTFARLAVKVTESDSGIDVALTKRFDTLTKMLDVTKAYAKHESETLGKMVLQRKFHEKILYSVFCAGCPVDYAR